MATLILIFLGDGVNANVLLAKSAAENSGWIVITTGWALAVMAGVFAAIACGSPDAHINPAVTLAFAIVSSDYSKLVPYAIAQILGAVAGATLVWLHYIPHWAQTSDALRKRACFCTTPSIRNTGANLLSEILGTFVLVLSLRPFSQRRSPHRDLPHASDRSWWAPSCGLSACALAERLAFRSTLRGIWGRGSPIGSCRSPAKLIRTGSMQAYPSLALFWDLH
jgi:glycerol uptake facilitator-like aquaporin